MLFPLLDSLPRKCIIFVSFLFRFREVEIAHLPEEQTVDISGRSIGYACRKQ